MSSSSVNLDSNSFWGEAAITQFASDLGYNEEESETIRLVFAKKVTENEAIQKPLDNCYIKPGKFILVREGNPVNQELEETIERTYKCTILFFDHCKEDVTYLETEFVQSDDYAHIQSPPYVCLGVTSDQTPVIIKRDDRPLLDNSSLFPLFGDSGEICIYGWDHCLWLRTLEYVEEMIDQKNVKGTEKTMQLYDHYIGEDPTKSMYTGRELASINFEPVVIAEEDRDEHIKRTSMRICKTGVTNIVLENIKRTLFGEYIIPVVFLIDITDNKYPSYDPEILFSKNPHLNNLFTHKELRRIYKLCHHKNPLIREVAKATFLFIKVIKNAPTDNAQYSLQKVASPWEINPKLYEESFARRKSISQSIEKKERYNWRIQLDKAIASYGRIKKIAAMLLSFLPDHIAHKKKTLK